MPHVSSPLALIVLMCVCEVLTTLDAFAFASMLPHFQTLWSLSATELGWISGIFFAGYTLAVPVLVSLTDRLNGSLPRLATPSKRWNFTSFGSHRLPP